MRRIDTLQKEFAQAVQHPFTYDRLHSLEGLAGDVRGELGRHRNNKSFAAEKAAMGIAAVVLTLSITASFLTMLFVAPASAGLAAVGIIAFGTIGSMGAMMPSVGKYFSARYERKHAAALDQLDMLQNDLGKALDAEYGFIGGMTAEGAAGLVHLEKIIGEFPRARERLVDIFRWEVSDPVLEQSVSHNETPAMKAMPHLVHP